VRLAGLVEDLLRDAGFGECADESHVLPPVSWRSVSLVPV
jgi:hypothetical protein